MQEYWKVIDNKWEDDCPCYDNVEEAIMEAKHAQERNNRWDKEKSFKVRIFHILSEEVQF